MKHVFSSSCAVFLSLLLLVTSCKKGDTGPAGADGPPGPAGPQGPQGPKGDSGTANVIYSEWLDIPFEKIYDTADNGDVDSFHFGGIEIPEITDAYVNGGEVRAYINLSSSTDPLVMPLPFQDLIYYWVEGALLFESDGNRYYGTLQDNNNVKYQQFRYILIPGGTPARSAINWNDYNSVKEYLKLKD